MPVFHQCSILITSDCSRISTENVPLQTTADLFQ